MLLTHAEWLTAGNQLTNVSFLPQESLFQGCLNDSVGRAWDYWSQIHEFKPHIWCKAHLKKYWKKKESLLWMLLPTLNPQPWNSWKPEISVPLPQLGRLKVLFLELLATLRGAEISAAWVKVESCIEPRLWFCQENTTNRKETRRAPGWLSH